VKIIRISATTVPVVKLTCLVISNPFSSAQQGSSGTILQRLNSARFVINPLGNKSDLYAAFCQKLLREIFRRPNYMNQRDHPKNGGEGGIRTHGRVSPTHAFQACSLNRSDTSPQIGFKQTSTNLRLEENARAKEFSRKKSVLHKISNSGGGKEIICCIWRT
jgi:hypothetical protein